MATYCTYKAPQIIEGQYLDQQKLMCLLKNVYGTSEEGQNKFRVEVRSPGVPILSILAADTITLTVALKPVQNIPLR